MKQRFNIIVFLIFFILFSPTDYTLQAQIIIKEAGNKPVLLLTSYGGRLIQSDGKFYYCGTTSNQFDDPMILDLGSTPQEAIETIETLMKLREDPKNETLTIESLDIEYTLSAASFIGEGVGWKIYSTAYAGTGNLFQRTSNKMIAVLKKMITTEAGDQKTSTIE